MKNLKEVKEISVYEENKEIWQTVLNSELVGLVNNLFWVYQVSLSPSNRTKASRKQYKQIKRVFFSLDPPTE